MKRFFVFLMFGVIISMFPVNIFAQAEEGNATWYKSDLSILNASHAKLPLGTRLRVTSLVNDKVVYVTVSNRIPVNPYRLLDISEGAASILEMTDNIVTPVKFEVVRGNLPEEPAPVVNGENAEIASEEPEALPAAEPETPAEPVIAAVPEPAAPAEPEPAVVPAVLPAEIPAEIPAIVATPEPVPQPPVRTVIPESKTEVPTVQVVQTAVPPAPVQPKEEPDNQDISIKVIVTVNGKEHVINVPVTDEIAAAVAPAPAKTSTVKADPVKIIPKMPDPQSKKIYRVQVGAFSNTTTAQNCYDRVKNAGYSPSFEKYNNLYRVVISGVKASDMPKIAQGLGSAGFTEVWLREETK